MESRNNEKERGKEGKVRSEGGKETNGDRDMHEGKGGKGNEGANEEGKRKVGEARKEKIKGCSL